MDLELAARLDELLACWHEVAPFVVRQGQLAQEQGQGQEEEPVPHDLRLLPRLRARCERPGWQNGQYSEHPMSREHTPSAIEVHLKSFCHDSRRGPLHYDP
jgi:hypothetical protein